MVSKDISILKRATAKDHWHTTHTHTQIIPPDFEKHKQVNKQAKHLKKKKKPLSNREASHSAEAHDSSTSLSKSIHTVHYTNVGFPIPKPSSALGASRLSVISVFGAGVGGRSFC